jgi:hypothetical protein
VAAGEQGDQGLIHHLALAKNDAPDALPHQLEALAQRFDVGEQVFCGGGKGLGNGHGLYSLTTTKKGRASAMADKSVPEPLRRLASEAAQGDRRVGRPPPRDLGEIGIRIASDGSWFYRGSPITRLSLARLFASVLRRESDGAYWLVTPAERSRISVDDAPFLAVELDVVGTGQAQVLSFRTNMDEIVTADGTHPIRVATDPASAAPSPYILVRDGLEAKLTRPVFYQLVDLGREERVGDAVRFGVWSKNQFFPLGELD